MDEARRHFIVRNPRWLRRGYTEFARFITAAKQPVVLLEGSRNAPAEIRARMEQLAAQLMRTFPSLIARRGNAEGSDQAWARGVKRIDSERLPVGLPGP